MKTSRLYICIFILQIVRAQELSDLADQVEDPQTVPMSRGILTIDLSLCSCQDSTLCEFTILRSSILDLSCVDGESLCCPVVKSSEKDETEPTPEVDGLHHSLEADSGPAPQSNVRVYSITPGFYGQDGSEDSQSESRNLKTKKNCVCKSRETCPHEYIDYGFGFQCTSDYKTVRCCIPSEDNSDIQENIPSQETESLVPQINDFRNDTEKVDENENEGIIEEDMDVQTLEIQPLPYSSQATELEADLMPDAPTNFGDSDTEGELMITEVTSWNDEDSNGKDITCFCMPVQKCRSATNFELNSIERRRDTLCPGDLIQCCGENVMEEITKKKDDDVKSDLPPYQEPIQLPNSNVPVPNETEQYNQRDPQPLSPPQLPTHYNYDAPPYNKGYNYIPNSYNSQFSGPPNPQRGIQNNNGENIRPWVSLASPSAYSNYPPNSGHNYQQGYPRGPYPQEGTSRSSKPAGLFDTLAQMLG